MLAEVYGKRPKPEQMEALKRVFCDALENLPESAISKGFSKAEQVLERFPTPKAMRELCSEFVPNEAWRRDYKAADGTDPETGDQVRVLIDPAPESPKDRSMYRPQDCPEGRLFLLKLRSLARKQQ